MSNVKVYFERTMKA